MSVHQGSILAGKKKFGIVVSRFNDYITSRLLEGAVTTLRKAGAPEKNIKIICSTMILTVKLTLILNHWVDVQLLFQLFFR